MIALFDNKKKFVVFMLSAVFMLLIPLMVFGCQGESDPPKVLTDQEVVAETKLYLNDKFSSGKVLSKLSLPKSYELDGGYKSYISWESSNNKIINPTTGVVSRNLENQNCNLTAKITYKEIVESETFYLTIPANIYKNSSVSFPKDDDVEFRVCYIAKGDDGITLKLKVANFLPSKKNLTGISKLTFSIYGNYQRCLIKNLTYTSQDRLQFNCPYDKCVEMTLPVISYNNMYSDVELTTNNFYIKVSELSYWYS